MKHYKIEIELEVLADSEADARARVIRALSLIQDRPGIHQDTFTDPEGTTLTEHGPGISWKPEDGEIAIARHGRIKP